MPIYHKTVLISLVVLQLYFVLEYVTITLN